MPKTLTMYQLARKRYKTMDFEGLWADSFGQPEYGSNWLIYGESGHGKTSFCMQLAKYISQFGRVLYVSAEEGDKQTIQKTAIRNNVLDSDVLLAVDYTMEDLRKKMNSRKIKTVVLDSVDDFGEKMSVLQELLDSSKNFIAVSWSEGEKPKKEIAKALLYKSDIKIHVNHYLAEVRSRYEGGQPFIIWEEKAKENHHFLNL